MLSCRGETRSWYRANAVSVNIFQPIRHHDAGGQSSRVHLSRPRRSTAPVSSGANCLEQEGRRPGWRYDSRTMGTTKRMFRFAFVLPFRRLILLPHTTYALACSLRLTLSQIQTIVGVFHYAASHLSRNFRRPNDFVPERWLPNDPLYPEFADDSRDAIQPFSTGPRNCVGRK